MKSLFNAGIASGILSVYGLTALAQTSAPPAGVVIEAEDFKPQGAGWKVVLNDHGNYMTDIIGFQHISGERVLSADAKANDAKAVATVQIPEAGDYRVWSRYEAPTGTEEQFRVEIRQSGKLVGSAVMGEKDAPKFWFGDAKPIGQYDISYGSEGLVEQSFDVKGLQAGPAEITLVAIEQPEPAANRNVDFLFLTRDFQPLKQPGRAELYPILDAALPHISTRYFVRLTTPQAGAYSLTYQYNRGPWYVTETNLTLEANKPSEWIPLKKQDVCHFTGVSVNGPGTSSDIRVELAGSATGTPLFRAIDWKDPQANSVTISLPPYPNKYKGESIQLAEEQYHDIAAWLKAHPSKVGREPKVPLNYAVMVHPIWQRGRLADAAADLWFDIGMRAFGGGSSNELAIARERFEKRGLTILPAYAVGEYRFMPTPENVAAAKKRVEEAGAMPLLRRFDYGDEIAFSEWLSLLKPEELKAKWTEWQQKKHGRVNFESPDSSAATSKSNPRLYVDSREFYEDAAIEKVASMAQEITKQMGTDVVYGGNVALHPWYYPEIAKDLKWFRRGAATFGRHSEYFWQVGQPGPLINAYAADHFRSGMRDNPKSVHLQYTMPHSPGNTDASFRRTAFSHLAHGARGLDYFAIGVNSSWTENYIDFRDPERYGAIRDINRAMATIEDILPESRVVPSQVAMILSDSTEHWDFAGIATDKAGLSVFAANYKDTRLCFHMERVGIYYALVHGNRSPDLLIEEDDLKDYKVAYWVGDCIRPDALKRLEQWVQQGGQLFATAGAFHFDQYKQPLPAGLAFLGLKSAKLDEKQTFFRPQIELPRLAPLDHIGDMPVFGVVDRVEVADAKVVATFKSSSPAVVERTLGKGKITYIAALPGATCLWSAYQPPPVPTRNSAHITPSDFNAEARSWILGPAKEATPQIEAEGSFIDARLIKSSKGHAIPLANYSADVTRPVTLTIRGVPGIQTIISANHGELKLQREKDGSVRFQYPTGCGDILRVMAK